MASKHTIILVQYTSNYNSRSYLDFPTVGAAMDGIFNMNKINDIFSKNHI